MRGAILAGVVVTFAVTFAAPASGASVEPWDGSNPFICTLQQAGEGTTFPDPNADPFCVDYDKTHQDITELGLVTFLSKEPARVAAAVDKCWYYQQDHWTGQIIAGDGSTETYHFDGHYFFDRRWGNGGVHVENFTINHQTADPSQLPGFPASWKPYFGPGRGGVVLIGKVQADPSCQAKPGPGHYTPYKDPGTYSGAPGTKPSHGGAGGGSVHRGSGSGGGAVGGGLRPSKCPKLGGPASRGLGKARLGRRRAALMRALGRPTRRSHGFLHFCVRGGRDLAVHLNKHGRADFAASTARTFHAGRTRVGLRLGSARRALRGERVVAHQGRNYVLSVSRSGWRLLVGVRRGRVSFLAAASARLTLRQLGALLVNSGR
jgi:hypothetical protein